MKDLAENAKDKDQTFITSELEKRYDIGKAARNARLNSLYINPTKQGRNFVISAEQLQLMDDLNAHLQAGGNTEEFVKERIAKGEIFPQQLKQPEESELVTQEQAQALTESQAQNVVETQIVSLGAVNSQFTSAELEAIDKQAQLIAYSRYYITQELADYYANTGNFTIPHVIESIEQRRSQTSSQWEKAHSNSDPKILAQILIQKANQRSDWTAFGQEFPPSKPPESD